jgi:hypothetical protein
MNAEKYTQIAKVRANPADADARYSLDPSSRDVSTPTAPIRTAYYDEYARKFINCVTFGIGILNHQCEDGRHAFEAMNTTLQKRKKLTRIDGVRHKRRPKVEQHLL